MRRIFSAFVGVILLMGLSLPVWGDGDSFLKRVQADTAWLTEYGSRQVGSSGHRQVQQDLLKTLQDIPNVQVFTQEFPVVVPVHERTVLELSGGELAGTHDILPVWPDVGRLNTTPRDGWAGELVYVGNAEFGSLPARRLRGNIAVMESSAYGSYRRVFDFGAKAVVFVESERAGGLRHTRQPLSKPRYFVPAGPLADALRSGDGYEGVIHCRGSWKTVTARNYYAAVQGPAGTEEPPYALVSAYDSMSRVVGLAPGADAAVDCALMLNLLRDMAKAPSRPLLFGFLDAYHINQAGMRHFAAMSNITPNERTRKAYDDIEAGDLDLYGAAVEELDQFSSPEEGLAAMHDRSRCEQLRRLFKDAAGSAILRLQLLQGEVRLAAGRTAKEMNPEVYLRSLRSVLEASIWLNTHHPDEFEAAVQQELQGIEEFARSRLAAAEAAVGQIDGAASLSEADFEAMQEQASTLLPHCSSPLRARNRILEAIYSAKKDVPPEYMHVAKTLWHRVAERARAQLADQENRREFFVPLDGLRAQIRDYLQQPVDEVSGVACEFVLSVDLSDCGVLAGPGRFCGYNEIEATNREFSRSLKRAVKNGELWPEGSAERRAVNVEGIERRLTSSATLGERALMTSVGASFQLPGITWITDDADRRRVDSPLDRYDRLDWARIAAQIPPTRQFVDWVLTTDAPLWTVKRSSQPQANWRHGMGRIVDISAGETVPRVPRSGFLVTLVGNRMNRDGIRAHEFTWTQADGAFRLPLLCAEVSRLQKGLSVSAFLTDQYGTIQEALTTAESMVTARLATTFSLNSRPGENLPRAVTFACAELNGPSFFDARFMQPLEEALLQDTVRGGSPKQGQFEVEPDGQMWGLVPPDTRWQIVMSSGPSRVRMALLNTVEDGRTRGLSLRETFQRGYGVREALPSIPEDISARDLSVLNEWRLADFRSAGIESHKIEEIREATQASIQAADAAMDADDGAALHRAAVTALGHEIRAYQAVKDLGMDIARGAIFLMLMLVPFCIAMERLLFACARISAQIASAIGIFAGMTGLLWSFHPAFKISAQPLIIVMAFTILALSIAVICVVMVRFKGSVQEFQSTLAEGSGAKMSRGGLLGSAVFLGIANMRKRKVRTLLTGTTIVLVTFALLCFSSASSYIDKKDFRIEGATSSSPSVLIRRPSFGSLEWKSAATIANLLEPMDVELGARAWLGGGLGDANWRLNVIDPETGRQQGTKGALGLSALEDRLTGVGQVLEHWEDFTKHGGCYLSQNTAEALGVRQGDEVVIRGHNLVVRGLFDPLRLENEIQLLDGQRITPYDYTKQEDDRVDRDTQDAVQQEMESAGAMQPEGGDDERYVSARELVILPISLVKQLKGSLRSFGIACKSPEHASEVANELMNTIAFPAYYSNADGGVNVVVATPLVAVPPKNLAIPLIIAAMIIFTTMLNSVSERKSEIYVYTSLGLAPTHVGMLFVAEALTYGLMGAVFGYVAGQGTASLLTAFGLMEGITLNYSGTAVIQTMLLVQLVVVLSAIVPAIAAGRIAAPSTEMDWRVPEPKDGVIQDMLPFTVNPASAKGLVAFIFEYLEAHRDGVLGGFDVDKTVVLPEGTDGSVAALECGLWLEPYDMGVRQRVRLRVFPSEDGACAIDVEIHHEAGAPKTWWRLNKPFFIDLRRQLLGWRKLSPERVQQYMKDAEGISG